MTTTDRRSTEEVRERELGLGDIEVLIREARRHQRRRKFWIASAVVFSLLLAGIAFGLTRGVSGKNTKPVANIVSNFVGSAQRALDTQFTATYQVTGTAAVFGDTGEITVARIPLSPGVKPKSSPEGFLETGQYAYVAREANGNVIQWIQNDGDVSWCEKFPHDYPLANAATLKCSGSEPYIPSNGYAMEGVPYVPSTAILQIGDMIDSKRARTATISAERSTSFGQLRCLNQLLGSSSLTTCENGKGFIVSTKWRNQNYSSAAVLESFSNRANPHVMESLTSVVTKHLSPPPF